MTKPTVEYRIMSNGAYLAKPVHAAARMSLKTPRRTEASVSATLGHALYRLQCAIQHGEFGRDLFFTPFDAQIEKTVISETPARWELVNAAGTVVYQADSEGAVLHWIRNFAGIIDGGVMAASIKHIPAEKTETITVLE